MIGHLWLLMRSSQLLVVLIRPEATRARFILVLAPVNVRRGQMKGLLLPPATTMVGQPLILTAWLSEVSAGIVKAALILIFSKLETERWAGLAALLT